MKRLVAALSRSCSQFRRAQGNTRDKEGNTALSIALTRGYSEVTGALRRAGANWTAV
jgi:hypothetical protein